MLPKHYRARVDETVQLVQLPEDDTKPMYPDVAISRGRGRPRKSGRRNGKSTAVLEPVVIPHEFVGR